MVPAPEAGYRPEGIACVAIAYFAGGCGAGAVLPGAGAVPVPGAEGSTDGVGVAPSRMILVTSVVGRNTRLATNDRSMNVPARMIVAFTRKSEARRTPNIVPTPPGAPKPPARP